MTAHFGHHSVIVVGAGPVGLTLAAELGVRGVDTLVLEASATTTRMTPEISAASTNIS